VNPLDVDGELDVRPTEDGAAVTIPLAQPEGDWIRDYNQLARSEGLEARVEPQPGGVVLRINLPSDISREQTFGLLDAAVALIERAKVEANDQAEAALAVDRHVREWWSGHGSSPS
jgi:hypothetical protein